MGSSWSKEEKKEIQTKPASTTHVQTSNSAFRDPISYDTIKDYRGTEQRLNQPSVSTLNPHKREVPNFPQSIQQGNINNIFPINGQCKDQVPVARVVTPSNSQMLKPAIQYPQQNPSSLSQRVLSALSTNTNIQIPASKTLRTSATSNAAIRAANQAKDLATSSKTKPTKPTKQTKQTKKEKKAKKTKSKANNNINKVSQKDLVSDKYLAGVEEIKSNIQQSKVDFNDQKGKVYGRDTEKALTDIRNYTDTLCREFLKKYVDWQKELIIHAQKERSKLERDESKFKRWETYRNFKAYSIILHATWKNC